MRDLPAILIWELLRLGFAVLRDRTVLRGYRQAIQLSSRAFHKRRLLQQKLRSPERRRRWGGAAREQAEERYAWPTIVKDFEALMLGELRQSDSDGTAIDPTDRT